MPPLHSLLRSAATRRPLRTSGDIPAGESSSAAAAGFKIVRDRGLDHAVERERNLLPLINTKNLLASEPSKSLPISAIADLRSPLRLPTRPVDFLRRFPAVFREFLPGGLAGVARPHFGLTDAALNLHADENLLYASETYRRDVADRLLKLLMLCRANRLPIPAIEALRWDLGLPEDFERSLIPDFPDYFRVTQSPVRGEPRVLELVCWIGELGKSALEKKAKSGEIRFPMEYSRGFEMEKKYTKWIEDWQRLPYFSPYEDWSHLLAKSEESERYAVAVLQELLHILVPKKTEKESALLLGECLGLRASFKRAIFQLPGIFYLSNKNDTYTLVLKEGYKRGLLVENHPLMSMRSKYIHLMNSAGEEKIPVSVPAPKPKPESSNAEAENGEDEENGSSETEEDGDGFGGGEENGVSERRRRKKERARNLDGGRSKKRRGRSPRKFSLGTEKKERMRIGRSSAG